MSATNNGRNVMVQGRIVWVVGDMFKGRQRVDQNTKQPVIDQRTGQPKMEYGFGLAVPKSVLQMTGAGQPGEIWAAMHEEARTLYPSGNIPPGFSMKFKDGDGIDHNGIPFSQREGYAGCIVFSCTTSIPVKFFRFENGQNFQINEGIKCGDYVNVQLNIKAHPAHGTGKPGLYLNPNAVQFLGYGKEIINTPSGDQVFGTQAPALPPGASATPLAPQAGMIVPPAQSFGGVPAAQQGFAPPQATAEPHYGVLPPIHQPAVQQPQAMPQSFAAPSFPATTQSYAPPVTQQYQQPVQPQGFGTSGAPQASGGGMPMPSFPIPGMHR